MKNRFQRTARGLALTLALFALAACSTGPRVRTDHDPQANFAGYQTYAFYEPLAMEASGYSNYLSAQIKTSIRREMEAHGYRFDPADPDLRVNFQGVVRERTSVYDVPRSDVRWFYSYRARSYVAVPVWYDETRVNQYTEGTLTVDLVDADQNRLVWTGDAIGRVTQKTAPERIMAADRAINAIFAQFPYYALGTAPPMPAR